VGIATALCARATEGETLEAGKNRRSAVSGKVAPPWARSAKAWASAGDTLGILGVRGEGVGVSKSTTDCRGEPLSRWKLARSPEGVSAMDTLDRTEDGGCCPTCCDADCCNCDCDCDCDRECVPLLAGVTGPTARGRIESGGDGEDDDDVVR
jgi:hypothetical protein